MLQKKLDDMTSEVNALRADANKKLGAQAEELKWISIYVPCSSCSRN